MAEYHDSDHPPFRPATERGICDCCRYGPVPVIRSGFKDRCDQPLDVCQVCYRTLVGIWAGYPDVHDHTKAELGKLIAWGVNFLADVIGRPAPPEEAGP